MTTSAFEPGSLVLAALTGEARAGQEIVDGTRLRVGTLFATLDRLQAGGLVEREHAAPPRYRLTDTGRRAPARAGRRPCVLPLVLLSLVTLWVAWTAGQRVPLLPIRPSR